MTDKELVEVIDSVGLMLFDMEFKGKQCIKMAEVLKLLNAVRNELNNRENETVSSETK